MPWSLPSSSRHPSSLGAAPQPWPALFSPPIFGQRCHCVFGRWANRRLFWGPLGGGVESKKAMRGKNKDLDVISPRTNDCFVHHLVVCMVRVFRTGAPLDSDDPEFLSPTVQRGIFVARITRWFRSIKESRLPRRLSRPSPLFFSACSTSLLSLSSIQQPFPSR